MRNALVLAVSVVVVAAAPATETQGARKGHLRLHPPRRRRAGQLADVLGQLPGPSLIRR